MFIVLIVFISFGKFSDYYNYVYNFFWRLVGEALALVGGWWVVVGGWL
jgi:hypothetical protein